ncbi:MAG TPA: ABC transporter substrate-binding protein [Arenibaculum sp.]|nr:ABC transporter substrate-binding protein [Arenibaculum sp.]
MITRRLFLVVVSLAAIAGWMTTSAQADSRSEAAARFVQDLGARAVDVLIQPDLERAESEERFRTLLSEGFDVPYIGRFVLGRYWLAASPDQQREYLDLFEKLIIQVYADRFSEYSAGNLDLGETLRILGHRPEGERDAIVDSQIVRPDGPPVAVQWRVRDRDGTPKIIDVAVEGVSMSVTQRNEFSSVIQRGGGQIEALLRALRDRTAGG